ncbi:Exodeoxyribonuclease VII large subunit [Rubellimicrobium thermophilum DSM 16684]|uniref:Exodeoxyribonuclease 7 large subunit n=1 Tax=Rubellimicrobium thermophilum DSM 16684 TaxID=1123069 RepID=S9R603_9RHOB|nr:exodeoxyribonuclease VII large subunit [Rubellimicrobium thermophilum]EPX87428.1 Exodeoxyribonuclease VII large subunit [Rubellimicrobium thermophilum DSM 16684]
MVLIEDGAPDGRPNAPEYSVSELSAAVRRMVEGEFPFVRVRGEVGRVSRPGSGHLYFDLKDANAVLAAVVWKGQAARLTARPEEGQEVVAIGRLTTFPGSSKYQIIVEDLVPAGAGALMAQLEARRRKLAAEGLFDAARKKPIPYLPRVIGVVTSPSGAVIRDILHRLRDRFPSTVLVWPVAVQGAACAPEVAAAVRGFNALPEDGPIPRPDLLIVARGGGSIEDLWGFNDEAVVRAVADSAIPVISAVGHETDTTLIDHAADLRAPTPTAAAELAVPVRAELLERVEGAGARLSRGMRIALRQRSQRLGDLGRALPRGEALIARTQQRLDLLAIRLPRALQGVAARGRVRLADLRLSPSLLRRQLRDGRRRLEGAAEEMTPACLRGMQLRHDRLAALGSRLDRTLEARLDRPRDRLAAVAPRLLPAAARLWQRAGRDFDRTAALLTPDLPRTHLARLQGRLDALARLNETLSYRATLARGYAVVRSEGGIVTTAAGAARHPLLQIEFADGVVPVVPRGGAPASRRRSSGSGGEQGSLL